MAVTYKQVGEGCEYTIEPMYSGAGEVLTIAGSKRREPAKSGLMLESAVSYPVGTLVQLDIKFPGQEYTYRAKGIVSLVEDAPGDGAVPIGITITGMDKLDKYGISVAISEAQPTPPPAPPANEEVLPEPSIPPLANMQADMPSDEAYPEADFSAASEEPEYEEFEDNDYESDDDMEYDDTALNPVIDHTGDEQAAPPSPRAVESMQKTRIQDYLSTDDFTADTIPPGLRRDGSENLFSENLFNDAKQEWEKSEELKVIFQTLSLMMPQDGFGEKVYFEEVFVTANDSIPPSVEDVISSSGKRANFQVRVADTDAGRLCAILPASSNDSPPSSYVIEQLFLMYTGLPVQIIRDKETPLDLSNMACVARLASGNASMRAVMGLDTLLVNTLLEYRTGPIPAFDERLSLADVEYDDRASRVSLVVADDNDRHRMTVPVEARISHAPAKVTGLMSSEINSVVVEAFESMEALYNAENHDEASKFALSLARRLIKCEAAICTLLAPEQEELYIAAIDGAIPETRLGARLSRTDGLIGFCMRSGKVARSDHPKEIKASLLRETGLAVDNIMCAPITTGNHAIGAIELMNSTDANGFNRESADLIAYIANSLGDFIESADN